MGNSSDAEHTQQLDHAAAMVLGKMRLGCFESTEVLAIDPQGSRSLARDISQTLSSEYQV
jgi:hypothetical protein